MPPAAIAIEVSRFVDDDFPGFVECIFVDAAGQSHVFVDKIPIVTTENLEPTNDYPQPGAIRCEIEAEWVDAQGRSLARITTDRPDSVESADGQSCFVVLASGLRLA